MKNEHMRITTFSALAQLMVLALTLTLFWGCAKQDRSLVVREPQEPSAVQSEHLKPGLSVLYFYEYYRYIYQMPKGELIAKKGKPGPPIQQLNHHFKDGKVFDSGESKGVGMVMTGYLHFEQPGQYAFQSLSNDGFELSINDHLIINDPEVHSDKLSDQGYLTVSKGGWFPVSIKYFQRKGTATLVLYWQPPGAGSFVVVPATVYAHQEMP